MKTELYNSSLTVARVPKDDVDCCDGEVVGMRKARMVVQPGK